MSIKNQWRRKKDRSKDPSVKRTDEMKNEWEGLEKLWCPYQDSVLKTKLGKRIPTKFT